MILISTMKNRAAALLATLFLTLLLPASAFAAGAEANVKLNFSGSDFIYLYASLAFAVLSIGFAFYFQNKVTSQSPGDEKMQEVGNAISAGAMAYLLQQVRTMLIFVVILFGVLVALYWTSFGPFLAIMTGVAFMAGVGASYFAGFMGMKMAVLANMRTAHAALTSYKRSLETAFQAGAVAGLYTVGMGLLGATLIFIIFKENASKLLIGFGFGGSLAALFMRVGGGIFTKAADVGADLVGKVEAGIPEDDPRNPATIADNVGDNVGDCAGMAADVFESYEVTLVAAIVLGAATAAIFPQEIWIKLILFAMMARGVGIVASIVGIFGVKGSDDLNSDPLTSIRKGFYGSAAVAGVLTAVLAFFMLGGTGKVIETRELVPAANLTREVLTELVTEAKSVAKSKNVEVAELTADELAGNEKIKAALARINLPAPDSPDKEGQLKQIVTGAATLDLSTLPNNIDASGFRPLDFNDKENAMMKWGVPNPDKTVNQLGQPNEADKDKPAFISLAEAYGGKKFVIAQVTTTTTFPPQPAAEGQAPQQMPPQVDKQTLGPDTLDNIKKQLDQRKEMASSTPGAKFEYKIDKETPAELYANQSGDFLLAADLGDKPEVNLLNLQPSIQIVKLSADKLNALEKKKEEAAKADTTTAAKFEPVQPERAAVNMGIYRHAKAEWWRFALCILFGLGMAFVFEWLTDYYVGLHKRPVQELGEVSTAGPAPMIISGFAYGSESSVFSVFAIVASLIAPLLIFPPAQFGGYLLSFYGIALVGLGLLTTTGFILAMDTFGPISDNSQGVFEMSGAHHGNPEGARRVQLLDAAGNTTKALTKGFAIATAVVAAVALFHAFVEEGHLTTAGMRLEIPEIFLGMLLGGAAPYLFSAFSIQAVGRAAFDLINEVRRQFREDPGIMAGTSKPDYARCVAISTAAAQKELISPGLLAVFFPVFVAFAFSIGKPTVLVGGHEYNLIGAQALGGFLAGTILSGQLLAVMLANSGGMWDNAKKLIEDGLHGGKGTEAHKAAVVCDTVGDPFKDTAGPALNPLIKVMNLVALLIAPVVIMPMPQTATITVTLVAAAALVFAIYLSKKGSMGDSMEMAMSSTGGSDKAVGDSSANESAPSTSVEEKDPEA